MKRFALIEHNKKRVLTTAQLAESYGTDATIISNNFNRNKNRYMEGKHFFLLEGEELKDFKTNHQNDESSNRVNRLYLWTEKGAWMHAKSLNTDKAWEAYEILVDGYYNKNDILHQFNNLSPELRQMISMELKQKELEENQKQLRQQFNSFTQRLTSIPDSAKVVDLVNEYSRWTRLGHNEVFNMVYDIMRDRYGIDIQTRVANERERINADYFARTGKSYAESTLKKKVNGIDVMVREGALDKFYKILVGLLEQAKTTSLIV